ncbi:hypothetical protein [Neorhizobium sp. JUb45]|uniref:hypothetical protein n=1 Tax=Neorhizobium sp. JUb45 TaxID=2485113 RepID=UPI00105320DD|nr:hypothetical protein [Neorhizobium sp. JUb45]TCR07370.1 hypothetical protein EDF70_1011344 [Neorhizobium sp. JUb45]
MYDDLPEDHENAFVYLERRFREQLDESLKDNDQGSFDAYAKRRYMSAVKAAATSLDIPGIAEFPMPSNEREVWAAFEDFETDILNLTVQIEINHARRRKRYSVVFDGAERERLRHYIEQIRAVVEKSDAPQGKRDAIFKKLADLTLEIDRTRTRYEVVADAVLSVARLSGDVEREGLEPWWKWVKLIFGVIDDAKDKEPKQTLPAPEERKRLEAPRKQLPAPENKGFEKSFDDDIPF